MDRQNNILSKLCALVIAATVSATALAGSFRSSELSGWLERQPLARLQRLLAEHPRFDGQTLALQRVNDNALTDAVASLAEMTLQSSGNIVTSEALSQRYEAGQPGSIDQLSCNDTRADYQLRVELEKRNYSSASAHLTLLDNYSGEIVQQWQWRGKLSGAEKDYIKRTSIGSERGSPSSPWTQAQVADAAAALSRDFVCALRPWVGTELWMQWPQAGTSNPTLADTLRTSQHYIAAYRELAIVPGDGQFSVETHAEPLSDDVWQLWLVGRPLQAGLPTVEVATYLRAAEERTRRTSGAPTVVATPVISTMPAPSMAPATTAAPREALQIDVLGITRRAGARRADLTLRLRLTNEAPRALAYALKTTGGYFDGCRGDSASYRHDTWGSTSGSLAAGESTIATIRIDNLPHRPTPLRGRPVCVGFGDIDAFYSYHSQGERVTRYLSWAN
jgi:hypothetical protein